jgi:hypothetical protein
MKKWDGLPEWLRWILCWPIILLGMITVGLLAYFLSNMFLDRIWMPDILAAILLPAASTIVGCWFTPILFSTFIPRRPDIVALFPTILVIILGLMASVRWYFEIMENLVPLQALLTDILQTVAAVIVWVYVYYTLRTDHRSTM